MVGDPFRSLLERAGYDISFRRDRWVECLLLRGRESWLGRGSDESVALEAALRRACPSQLAWELLERAASEGARESPAARAAQSITPRAKAPPLASRHRLPPAPDLPTALDDLTILLDRIRESRTELGLCAPERQRLAILAWICEARAHTDHFPESVRIREEVAGISRQLGELGKCFWPGSVTALQLGMQPKDLPRHVLGGAASTWTRAAELAAEALVDLEHQDDRRGLDPYGWADRAFVSPAPARPREELDRLVENVEALAGPLERSAEPRDPSARPRPETCVDWVRSLRWLRATEIDPDRWARVAGRLRWWASRKDSGLEEAGRELDPAYKPTAAWAERVPNGAPLGEASDGDRALSAPIPLEVQDKRVAFVSPRRDPGLLARLESVLGFRALDFALAEMGRVEALAEEIRRGQYEIVLAGLGFQDAAHDQVLARACRGAGVGYLRVHRGQPGACLRALSRELSHPGPQARPITGRDP